MSKATKRERQKENRERARVERERLMKRDRRMKAVRGLAILMAVFVVGILIINAISSGDTPTHKYSAAPKLTIDVNKSYTATIETGQGNIVVALDPKTAPNAVNSFVFLAQHKFYDGLCIDRQSPNFVIQGGSPNCDRLGGPGYTVQDTPPTDGYPIGSLAAAIGASDKPGSFGSQFFIVTGTGHLDNKYAKFGTVVSGLPVAQKIEKLPLKPGTADEPLKKVKITKITIAVGATPPSSTSSAPASSSTTATTAPAASSTTASSPAASTTTTTKKP